jgi:uncharacterized damage-inducible protein DinB
MPAERIYYPQRVSEGKIGASVLATIKEDAMSGVAYQTNRRCFLKASAAISAAACGGYWLPPFAEASDANTENIIGPKPGYSPQIGTLVSMLTWMRSALIRPTQNLTQADLDYLFDSKANTIGALMLHLAATETYYQMNTFDGMKWDSWSNEIKQKWEAPMNLGDAGRKTIKGHDLGYYLNILTETREKSLAEFHKRDDAWLMSVDKDWYWGPTNNYCKWFHVCEHESHHIGQIAFLRNRLPGAKPNAD